MAFRRLWNVFSVLVASDRRERSNLLWHKDLYGLGLLRRYAPHNDGFRERRTKSDFFNSPAVPDFPGGKLNQYVS